MGVTLTKIVEKMELRNLTPDVDMTQREVKIPDINRPALQLAGFFDHFDCERIQLIGYVEYTYLQTLEYEHKMKIMIHCLIMGFHALFSAEICSRIRNFWRKQ